MPFGVRFILGAMLGVRPAVAAAGLAILLSARAGGPPAGGADRRRAVLLALLASALLLFGYGLTAQLLQKYGGVNLPRVLPTYHFFKYLKATESLLFGLGLAAGVRFAAGRTGADWAVPLGLTGLTLAVVAARFPAYAASADLTEMRRVALLNSADADRIALYHWLRAEAGPADVFLADPWLSVSTVSAANRKVVCMHDQFSNIYVDYHARYADLGRMYAALRDRDAAVFDAPAERYGVTHVVLSADAVLPCRVPADRMDPARWRPVFDRGPYRVFARTAPRAQPPDRP